MGEGAVYWICCNIGNYTVINPGRDFALARRIRLFFETEIGGYGDPWPPPFGSELATSGPSDIDFEYQSDDPTLASRETVFPPVSSLR